MAYSSNTFDKLLVEHVDLLRPETILDVGAGAGKNCSLIRENCSWKPRSISAVEPTQEYIEKHQLNQAYDKVYDLDILSWLKNGADLDFGSGAGLYDLVIISDVLEHLFRSEVFDTIDALLYRTKWLIVIWPTNLPQDAFVRTEFDNVDNKFEIHKSNFKLSDLASRFEVHHYVRQYGWHNWNEMDRTVVDFHYSVLSGVMNRTSSSLYKFPIWT